MSVVEWIAATALSLWITATGLLGFSLLLKASAKRDEQHMNAQLHDAQVFTSDNYNRAEQELIAFSEELAKTLTER